MIISSLFFTDLIQIVMKKILLNLTAIALVALVFTQCKSEVKTSAPANQSGIKIAYVNIDSLLMNYNEYKTFTEEFNAERQKSAAKLATKLRDLQKEAEDFQKKTQQGFYSRNQAKSIQQDLVQKEQKLRQLQMSLDQKLQEKQMKIRTKVLTKIDELIKKYSDEQDLDFVLSNPLFAKQQFNITGDITKMLNETK